MATKYSVMQCNNCKRIINLSSNAFGLALDAAIKLDRDSDGYLVTIADVINRCHFCCSDPDVLWLEHPEPVYVSEFEMRGVVC